ncbi:hypothetical protein UAJ10_17210 [Nitrospirillum sp. BR 11164]|uniref:hypothetical protein n=1 Tax=Nitrospirillum sp. BR 11164 TaxID=3104324 RepID=UPI002B000F75|nr:hypothetical protein [Nitrospirillum sp. BR 11164]MEA1650748.1 hypothetical protein [Nitrospirillum sp. BR 11164]
MTTRALFPTVAPFVRLAPLPIIAAASLAIRTPWAVAHAGLAALLFLWITADGLATGLIVAERMRLGRPPAARVVLAAIALGLVGGVLGLTPPLRSALADMPWVVAVVATLVGGHLLYGAAGAWDVLRRPGVAKLEAAAACFVPPPLAQLVAKELALLHLALFRWRAPPDVPPGCQAYGYHRDLTPLMGGLLAAQVMEIVVMDVALGIHHRTAALVLFAVGDVGFIYLLGLTKSFRLHPVLLTPQGVRIRFGLLADRLVPYEAIAHVGAADGLERRGPENLCRLVAPNVALTLVVPETRHRVLRPALAVTRLAFSVDEPREFIGAVRDRLAAAQKSLEWDIV